MEKEVVARTDIQLKSHVSISLRCALSFEHVVETWPDIRREWSVRRRKHCWRFVYNDSVTIECSRVHTSDVHMPHTMVVSHEVEMEWRRTPSSATWSVATCGVLVQTMVHAMIVEVLGMSASSDKLNDEAVV